MSAVIEAKQGIVRRAIRVRGAVQGVESLEQGGKAPLVYPPNQGPALES
jgi:hypothetical protein